MIEDAIPAEHGPWRVMVHEDFPRYKLAIFLAQKIGPNRYAVAQQVEMILNEHEEGTILPGPSLSIPDELGRALLDALSAHYGGTSDTRTLRRDYEHERSRVDRLIGLVAGAGDC